MTTCTISSFQESAFCFVFSIPESTCSNMQDMVHTSSMTLCTDYMEHVDRIELLWGDVKQVIWGKTLRILSTSLGYQLPFTGLLYYPIRYHWEQHSLRVYLKESFPKNTTSLGTLQISFQAGMVSETQVVSWLSLYLPTIYSQRAIHHALYHPIDHYELSLYTSRDSFIHHGIDQCSLVYFDTYPRPIITYNLFYKFPYVYLLNPFEIVGSTRELPHLKPYQQEYTPSSFFSCFINTASNDRIRVQTVTRAGVEYTLVRLQNHAMFPEQIQVVPLNFHVECKHNMVKDELNQKQIQLDHQVTEFEKGVQSLSQRHEEVKQELSLALLGEL